MYSSTLKLKAASRPKTLVLIYLSMWQTSHKNMTLQFFHITLVSAVCIAVFLTMGVYTFRYKQSSSPLKTWSTGSFCAQIWPSLKASRTPIQGSGGCGAWKYTLCLEMNYCRISFNESISESCHIILTVVRTAEYCKILQLTALGATLSATNPLKHQPSVTTVFLQ